MVELIKSPAEAEFRLAVVSSTTLENIQLITETLCIKSFFDLLVTGKDVAAGKPNPQGVLTDDAGLAVSVRRTVLSSRMQRPASEPPRRAVCIVLLLPILVRNRIWQRQTLL